MYDLILYSNNHSKWYSRFCLQLYYLFLTQLIINNLYSNEFIDVATKRLVFTLRWCNSIPLRLANQIIAKLILRTSRRVDTRTSRQVEEKQNGIPNLCTPKHSSVTHILVFPTSANAQGPADVGNDTGDDTDDLFKDFDNFDDSELINSIGGVDSPPPLKSAGPSSPRNGFLSTLPTSGHCAPHLHSHLWLTPHP